MRDIWRKIYRLIWSRFLAVWLRGHGYWCTVCGRSYRRFLPAGINPRTNALCPGCGSLERHRLQLSLLKKLWNGGGLIRRGRMLHVAPEKALSSLFRRNFEYVSIDLDGGRAMMAMDVTNLNFPDQHFDAVFCNHVLEHVPDDKLAMSELFRVLKLGGWGVIQVPIKGQTTHEDPSVSDPRERERLFGQSDHVRQYGQDFVNRLAEAGFVVECHKKTDWLDLTQLKQLSVACEQEVILVRREV